MSESYQDQLSRVRLMADAYGVAWDLSRSDIAAIKAMLKTYDALLAVAKTALDDSKPVWAAPRLRPRAMRVSTYRELQAAIEAAKETP